MFFLCFSREFGPKVLTLKLVLKQVPVYLEHRDKGVREEGKKLVVELYRWIGQALKPQLSALKPIQVTQITSSCCHMFIHNLQCIWLFCLGY